MKYTTTQLKNMARRVQAARDADKQRYFTLVQRVSLLTGMQSRSVIETIKRMAATR